MGPILPRSRSIQHPIVTSRRIGLIIPLLPTVVRIQNGEPSSAIPPPQVDLASESSALSWTINDSKDSLGLKLLP